MGKMFTNEEKFRIAAVIGIIEVVMGVLSWVLSLIGYSIVPFHFIIAALFFYTSFEAWVKWKKA